MADLIPQFGSFGFTLVFFVLALSIIVAVHEYGHYIVGRWSGIYAEVFSLGFGPVLYSRVDKRGTVWQIAALPFGGYVKFLGDANAASVGSSGDAPEHRARNTMHGAPLWARVCTVAAGPVFNFILSALIFGCLIMWNGRAVDPVRVADVAGLPEAYQVGIAPGDQLLSIEGITVPELAALGDMLDQVPVEPVVSFEVLRDGQTVTVDSLYPSAPLVRGVTPGSAAYDAGFQPDDVVMAIDGVELFAFRQITDAVLGSEGREMQFQIWRDGETLTLPVTPRPADLPTADGGFESRTYLVGLSGSYYFDLATETPGLGEAAGLAVGQVWEIMRSSLSGLYHMIAGKISTCNLSGPVGIAQASGAMAAQGPLNFIFFVGVISTAVGLLNLFPIPVLDGGHLVFHAYEAVTGKPPSETALKVMMAGGLTIVLSLMVFALANDLILCP